MAQDLKADLQKQFAEEIGTNQPVPDHNFKHKMMRNAQVFDNKCEACRITEQRKMVMQKYGMIPPQLTDKERSVIAREERRALATALGGSTRASSR